MQKFAGARLLLDCIHGKGQRLLVFTKVDKSRGQIAGKIRIQHRVTLRAKLLQCSRRAAQDRLLLPGECFPGGPG